MVTFGVMLPTSGPSSTPLDVQAPLEVARWADETAFAAVWVGDHIFMPHQFLESIVVMSMVAAETRRVRLGPCVLLLPMRQLAIVAKQLATLAVMSDGRLTIGVGVGGEFPQEWHAAGVPLGERGPRLAEGVALLRQLFAGDAVEYEGRFTQLPGVRVEPAPGTVPIVFGGRSPAALHRSAVLGDGWIGFLQTPGGFGRATAAMEAVRSEAGLADRPFERGLLVPFRIDDGPGDARGRAAEIFAARSASNPVQMRVDVVRKWVVAGSAADVTGQLGEYVENGCRHFIMYSLDDGSRGRENLAAVDADVIPRFS